jgi:penicillin amidase
MLKKTIVGILVVLIILFFSGYLYLQSLKPDYRGTIQLKGLSGKVEILYDDFAVPHIYAENEEDLFTAFGYVHAQDRLFQMELLKRVASGRLAEVFGKEMLSTDVFFRTLSFEKHAALAIAERDPDSPMMKASLAYLKGVNAYIRDGKTPIEFTLAGIPKEEFTLTDIEKIVGFMGYTFEAAFQSEAVLTYIQNKYGSDYIKDFSQSWPDGYAKLPVDANSVALKTAETLALIERNLSKINHSLVVKPFHGSNGWVVSGSKTKSGKPILSNDTHMAFSQPSVWYEAHLECPTLSVYGNFVAGTPVPALGHNRNGGWGLTMFENDEADFYEEKTNPENQNEVWYRDRWVALEIRKEKIRVKDGNDTTILVKKSPHGYILNGAFADITDDFKNPITLQWVYHQFPSKHMEVFYNLCKAQNVNDARKAVKPLTAPGLNFMWADVQGNIAWWAAGKLPIRPKHVNSFMILNGSSGDDDWQGYLDFDQNPQILNPENGFLFTANNQPEDMGAGEVPGYYVPSNRAKRIKELLDSDKNDWTSESMRPIINDVVSSTYPEIIDSLIKNADKNLLPAEFNEILTLLNNWKGEHELTSTEPTLYYRWIYEIYRHAMHDELGDVFFDSFDRSHAFKRSMRTFFLNESSPWWDNIHTPEKETRGKIFSNALIDAVDFLKKQLGENNSGWQWHKVHTLEHPHAMGKVKALRTFFNVGPFPAPGGSETINNLDFNMDSTGHYSVSSGPALRRIIDFATPESAHSVNPTGQSGYFFSKHYKDQAKMFVEGGYRNERMNRQEIERVKIGRMVLLP